MDSETQPIIIKKKKGGHGGHHGGAWKVAYADFVTAMMALFIVLWLLNTSENVKKAVAGYFAAPSGKADVSGSGVAGAGEGVSLTKTDMNKLKDKLEDAIRSMPKFDQLKDNLDMTVTGEGLRLELLETEKGMFFETGNASPTVEGNELIAKLAEELGKLPNPIVIEGHTDARPFTSTRGYTNWELSVDRANAARRVMQEHGVRGDQIKQVRGFADQHLRDIANPGDAANRRVTVIVQYPEPPMAKPGADDAKKDEHAPKGEHAPAAAEKPKHGA